LTQVKQKAVIVWTVVIKSVQMLVTGVTHKLNVRILVEARSTQQVLVNGKVVTMDIARSKVRVLKYVGMVWIITMMV